MIRVNLPTKANLMAVSTILLLKGTSIMTVAKADSINIRIPHGKEEIPKAIDMTKENMAKAKARHMAREPKEAKLITIPITMGTEGNTRLTKTTIKIAQIAGMPNRISPTMVNITMVRKAKTNKAHTVAIQHLTKTLDAHFATKRGTQPKTVGPYKRYKNPNPTRPYFFLHLLTKNQI